MIFVTVFRIRIGFDADPESHTKHQGNPANSNTLEHYPLLLLNLKKLFRANKIYNSKKLQEFFALS